MKKLIAAIVLSSALVLTACGPSGYSRNGGWSESDWDLNNRSPYNNQTYCQNGTYNPLGNGQYSCTRNGVTSTPSKRPAAVIPPKSSQKAPTKSSTKTEKTTPKKNTAPKPPAKKVQKSTTKTK